MKQEQERAENFVTGLARPQIPVWKEAGISPAEEPPEEVGFPPCWQMYPGQGSCSRLMGEEAICQVLWAQVGTSVSPPALEGTKLGAGLSCCPDSNLVPSNADRTSCGPSARLCHFQHLWAVPQFFRNASLLNRASAQWPKDPGKCEATLWPRKTSCRPEGCPRFARL